MYIASLIHTVDDGKKWYHFCFKGVCGPKAND